MTNETDAQYQVPAQYMPADMMVAPPTPEVRLTTIGPLGTATSRIDGAAMAELGALLGAMGAEQGAMRALFEEAQVASAEVWIRQMPTILAKFRDWERARLNRIMQAVKALQDAPVQQPGLLDRVIGPRVQPVVSYVSRAEVLQILAVAMEETPVVR